MAGTWAMGRDSATLRVLGWDSSSLRDGILGGADPLGFDAGDANLYRYVHNDPTDFTDPSGLQGVPSGVTSSPNMRPGFITETLDQWLPLPPRYGYIMVGTPVLTPSGVTINGSQIIKPSRKPGPLITTRPPGMTTVAPQSASQNITVSNNPNNQLVGVTGATPCTGVVLRPLRPGLPWRAYHFGPMDSPGNTLADINGNDYEAVVAGSVLDNGGSNLSLANTLSALQYQGIPVLGYVQSLNVYMDNQGNIYEFGVPPGHADTPPWRK
jgi:uncharacterized protein RhaS with RHS repeats